MKSAVRAMLTSLLCVALSIIASSQAPSRDAGPVTPTSGTASIAGIVVDDQQPPVAVRRAVVTVAGAELVPSRSAITDDDGRFSIGVLPAGRFTITVSRGAFVTSSYGAKRPGRPGTPIVVAAGARVSDVTITLWRGAVIAGVVRDEDGQPAPGVPVRATRANAPTDRSILTLDNRGVQTNEAGEFRIFGLEPGEYLVSAVPPSLRGMAPTSMSETEMDAALAALRSRRPGTTPPPPLASTHIAPPAARPFMYAPIFFPGTPSMTQATPITLAAGQVVERLDFALQRVATAIVGGIALRPGGEPAVGASVRLVQVPPPGGFALDSPIQLTASTAADGTFRFSGVSPADYRLNVGSAVLGTAAGRGGYQGPPSGGPALWGEAMLAVAGSDLDQIVVQLAPAPTLTGRVEFSGAAALPANPAQWRVSLVDATSLARKPGGLSAAPVNDAPPPVQVKADGTFEIQGIAPGVYQFQVVGPGLGPTGWWPRSMATGDRDLLDRFH